MGEIDRYLSPWCSSLTTATLCSFYFFVYRDWMLWWRPWILGMVESSLSLTTRGSSRPSLKRSVSIVPFRCFFHHPWLIIVPIQFSSGSVQKGLCLNSKEMYRAIRSVFIIIDALQHDVAAMWDEEIAEYVYLLEIDREQHQVEAIAPHPLLYIYLLYKLQST